MVTSSGFRLWIKASPRGTRSGFAVLPDGSGGRLTVTVLPKPWAPKRTSVQNYVHPPGATTHVVMHETETATINTASTSVGALAMSLADVAREQADLLALGSASGEPLSDPARTGDPFGQLIDLMLLAERGSLMGSPLMFEGAFALSLLRLLTHERLLTTIEGLLFRVRARYTERTETLEMPRGRLRDKSLMLSLATGTPRVESTFDELSTDTQLLQVIASSLRLVASDRLPPKVAALRPGLQARAVHLLRYLSGVTLVDRERALLVAERLWLGPLDQVWKPALDAALPVLRDWAVGPEEGAESTDAILVHVSVEKFWEQCMELALENAFSMVAVSRDARPGDGVDVPAPWETRDEEGVRVSEPLTKSFPDFVLRSGRRVVVADAKYKLATGSVPSSADGYQMFAYSHLATLSGRPSDLAVLLYPTPTGGRPGQLELERLPDHQYPLWLARVPFPAPLDLRSQGNWTNYIAGLAAVIRDFSTDWNR
ncbi:5-methylcytosine restriction system specificity protein McrC [Mycobacteroides abscessus]|uniref:5-methylcytosine restriction system specificity protein McrC n=2 Tax=Mycobacteroides abscessus TaxID=36809 RepID=UPI0013000D55|nr:hypothetical protein [Mycobacteroides abscessus]